MTETVVEKQVRLVLEQQCADIFMRVLAPLHGYEVTLILADYAEHAQGNMAFKTSLEKPAFLHTIESLLSAWEQGGPRMIGPDDARGVKLMTRPELEHLHMRLKGECPAGVGWVLLVGCGRAVNYIAAAERSSVVKLLTDLCGRRRAEARRP